MQVDLSPEEKQTLESAHRKERDGRVKDRLKAVLLSSEGWSVEMISQALRINEATVRTHLNGYVHDRKLKPENGGSISQLNTEQTATLISHLEEKTYVKVVDICTYVKEVYGIEYTVTGMTKWLHRHNFSYKQPKGTPAKADTEQQEAFIKKYNELMKRTPENEPIEFGDGVHPTMATKITCGWIRKGTDKLIKTTASRTRLNLFGSINLVSMDVSVGEYETVDSKAMEQHFFKLRNKYSHAPKIHLILDNGSYNKSLETREAAAKYGIVLHYIPPYSPNLNPIERLWKVLNEHVRNNVTFDNPTQFRNKILEFFDVTWGAIKHSMTDRINDNFQKIVSNSSS